MLLSCTEETTGQYTSEPETQCRRPQRNAGNKDTDQSEFTSNTESIGKMDGWGCSKAFEKQWLIKAGPLFKPLKTLQWMAKKKRI